MPIVPTKNAEGEIIGWHHEEPLSNLPHKYRVDWPVYVADVEKRINENWKTYGESSDLREPDDLIGEAEQEADDVFGWGYWIKRKLRQLKLIVIKLMALRDELIAERETLISGNTVLREKSEELDRVILAKQAQLHELDERIEAQVNEREALMEENRELEERNAILRKTLHAQDVTR